MHKIASDLTDFTFRKPIDLIYFDAFSPEAQPELWRVIMEPLRA
ncbi:MnmC family methyltransferase [Porphyromonas gingivalis]|nr:MnmC family methyltransferase [Porphyromonas gingivalis]